jgi:hypothetical protein
MSAKKKPAKRGALGAAAIRAWATQAKPAKKRTVSAWVYSFKWRGRHRFIEASTSLQEVERLRKQDSSEGIRVGPIIRVEVPLE